MRRRAFLERAGLAVLAASVRNGAARAAVRGAPRIVVAGAGFGGSSVALALRDALPRAAITVVDPDDRYRTCPMSNEVIVGMRGMDSITVSRRGLEHARVRYLRGRVDRIDARRRVVQLAQGGDLAYDRLVVAPGIRFLWDRIAGLDADSSEKAPHAWQAGRQTETLARQLRSMRAGGVFAICVPSGLMRCPPGPYERASLVAAYLMETNPRAKILILDANNHFPRQDTFTEFWRERYGAMIEWVPVVEGGALSRVELEPLRLHTSSGAHRVDVANVIPPQAPGALAVSAGLASEHGWCPVHPVTFESTQAALVHVIGDACIADPMPKSASAAHAQALQCAAAIAALEEGRAPEPQPLDSVCFSMLARGRALSIHARFVVESGAVREEQAASGSAGSAGVNGAAPSFEGEAREAEAWYRRILIDSFGRSI